MDFIFEYTENYNIGGPIYILEEESFNFKPYVESDFTLMLGCSYLGLNISTKTKALVNISGLCPKRIWKCEKLNVPQNVVKGNVILVTDEILMSGTGKDLLTNTVILYDSENNWFCIKPNYDIQSDLKIQFADNCILCLSKGRFAELWIKPKFE